jgi:hypothetical protein
MPIALRAPGGRSEERYLFVGSEHAGHAAAIYYSPVESCKADKISPLSYLT